MKEYLKKSFWKPGEYTNLILETTRMEGDKLHFDKDLFMSKINGKKVSEHGIAYDLHILYKEIGGRQKTQLMKKVPW